MQFVFLYLIGAFVLGGTSVGRRLLERPLALIVLSVLIAASFISIRVAV